MKVSPALIGKIVGAIVVIAICIPLFLWSKSNYTIKGQIQIDTGSYISPARNVDVKLILGSVDDELKMLVNEYESYKNFRKEETINSILDQKKHSPTNSSEKTKIGTAKIDAAKDVIKKMMTSQDGKSGENKFNLTKLDDHERELVTALVSDYYQKSNACRDEAADCPIGAIFYEKGSLFWENKADNLVENKRIVFDEITTNYVTTWVNGGLGGEPIQMVKTVIVTNITIQEIMAALGKTIKEKTEEVKPEEKVKKIDRQAILVDYNFSTNDIMNAVIELKRDLQQKHRTLLQKSDDLLIEMILDQVTTDENGNYIFKGKSIRQGKFFISSQYDILSSEGERIEFSWFHPANISLKRLTFNKSTIINLDELNQSKPPVNNIYIPDTEELLLDVLDGLKEKVDKEKAEINALTNSTNAVTATNIVETTDAEVVTKALETTNKIETTDAEVVTEVLEATNKIETTDNQ